jgi:hypothetical protein
LKSIVTAGYQYIMLYMCRSVFKTYHIVKTSMFQIQKPYNIQREKKTLRKLSGSPEAQPDGASFPQE